MDNENNIKTVRIAPVKGELDCYFIDDEGNLYRKLKTHAGTNGYMDFKFGNKGRHRRIHRIVAEAFIPNPDNKPEVNHIDRNIQNNHYSNLEWVTRKENMKHMYENGDTPVRNTVKCQLHKDDELVGDFDCILDAARYANEQWGASITGLQRNKRVPRLNIEIK